MAASKGGIAGKTTAARKPAAKGATASKAKSAPGKPKPEVIDAEVVEVKPAPTADKAPGIDRETAAPEPARNDDKPAPAATTQATPAPAPRNGPALAVSVIALLGVAGLGAMQLARPEAPLPEGLATTAAVDARIGELTARIESLETGAAEPDAKLAERVAAIDARAAAIEADLAAQKETLAQLSASVAGMSKRIDELATTAAASGGTTSEALSAEIEGLREQMRAMLAENAALNDRLEAAARAAEQRLEGLDASAAAAARSAAVAIAVARIEAALEDGSPFAAALDQVTRNGGPQPPEALARVAASGVPTITGLRQSFDDAARAAIRAENREGQTGTMMERFTAFLRTQVNPRALEETEGTDASAVLSRAAAALAVPDLDRALAEVATLGPAAAEAMRPWTEQATARRDALTAFAAYAAQTAQDG